MYKIISKSPGDVTTDFLEKRNILKKKKRTTKPKFYIFSFTKTFSVFIKICRTA